MKKTIALITLLSLWLCSDGLQAQNFSSCDQWASWNTNGYTIYNNIWGSGAGSQCLWAYDEGNWGVTADHPNTSGIKSYPNVDRDVNYTVSSMPNITASFNVSRPGWGSYNTAFDIWYDNYGYEIMLWMNWNGSMGPISYNYGCSGYPSTACPVATNINVGGHTWNLYEGTNGSATVYSFLRTSNTNSGTVNITQISQWLANNGYFSSNTNLHEIQFGFEISQSAGGADFTVNDYNVDIGSGNNGGGSGYVQLQNRGTGLYLDGMGRTGNGDACGQWANTNHPNSHWELIDVGGGYYQLQNRGTGLYLDGMGRTGNGDACGQWANTSHQNSHWELEQYSGNYYRLQNRGTGLYLDGMGRTSNGSDVGQWANTTHANAQWQLIDVSARFDNAEADLEELSTAIQLYPNPAENVLSVDLPADMARGKIAVYNNLGKLLMTREADSEITNVNISNLKAGMYIIKAFKEDRIATSRFIKL